MAGCIWFRCIKHYLVSVELTTSVSEHAERGKRQGNTEGITQTSKQIKTERITQTSRQMKPERITVIQDGNTLHM